ncbi:MAG: hypothetical protein U0521_24490 [Anaerolineae bacterium]
MNVDWFYEQVIEGAAQPPDVRHALYCELHTAVLDRYLTVLDSITPADALQPVNQGDDQCTLGQLIGHIGEWDRYAILSAGDILAGLRHPRAVTSIENYVEPDGTVLTFASVDDFNAFQAEKQASWSWEQLHDLARDSAQALHALFADEWLLNAQRLEQTLPWQKRLHNGVLLENITMGWTLWLLQLEHMGAEHAAELRLYDDRSQTTI